MVVFYRLMCYFCMYRGLCFPSKSSLGRGLGQSFLVNCKLILPLSQKRMDLDLEDLDLKDS